ncbi:HAMP domain-containing sensor histidine kinase [Clostridium perfringens]|uniref:sensor histidine kinase n=1 Tax=Clostridium perfringens TaxID=1502 RepID=UPI0013E2D9FF|nr:HAMP domain-containing sensor histidine kinase [Clostridium perfringens]EJT6170265.1 HAMP domain-containing histidine kinase [Clostridium perfringens]EJT6540989.1 HAMP domain-containing histidine kinase [Clostridium perfringens]EJT6565996.1 HAMP domain-containing histidine kinase [Clostridium perfringens]MBS5993450.1 HAMP domain-containing histidine kinase [Clostridium perfringens]MDM0996093.1 HAMP domain-containing sensor histidine kinase [Clostridium perfringens]
MEYKVKYENPKLQYYILRLIYILIILSAVFFIREKEYIMFYKFIDLSSAIMLGTALLIGISNKIGDKKNLVYFISIGIFWFVIPEIISLVAQLKFYVLDKMVTYKLIGILFQYFIILIIILGKKKNLGFKKFNSILLVLSISFNAIYLIIINNTNLMRAFINGIYINSFMFILVVFLFVLLLIIIVADEANTSDKFFYYLILYILLLSVGNIIFLNNLNDINNTKKLGVFFSQTLEFSAYYVLVEGIIRFSLNKSFNSINRIMLLKRESYKRNKRYLQKKIDELKGLEFLLEKEELLFNKMISIIGDYTFIFKDEKLFYLNNEALEFLGISDKESILFENMEVLYEKILKKQVYLKEQERVDSYQEIIFKNLNGGYSNGEVYTLPFGDNYKIIIINDITKKNNALRLNKYLKDKLEEENIKGEFFTNICHELRTPINVINSALQLNNLNIENRNLNSIERNNLVIKQNCLRLIRTINNFIDANKISEGQIETNIMVLNVVEVVENILDSSSEYISKKKINFIFDPDFEEIFIAIDSEFLERIILNLLSNSVKYGRENGNIYVKIYFEGKDLVIMIENDGIAISYDEQKYIFDKFTKSNKALNRTQEGSGLGLYISKSLMKMQGGDLKVDIYEGHGNRFKLYFYDVDLFKETDRTEHIFNNNYYNLKERAEIEFSDIYI